MCYEGSVALADKTICLVPLTGYSRNVLIDKILDDDGQVVFGRQYASGFVGFSPQHSHLTRVIPRRQFSSPVALPPTSAESNGGFWGEVSMHLPPPHHAALRSESPALGHVPRRMRRNPYGRPQNRPALDDVPRTAGATSTLLYLCSMPWRIWLPTHASLARD